MQIQISSEGYPSIRSIYFSMLIYNLMYCGSHSSSKQYIRIPCVIIYERDTNMIIVILIYHRRRFHTYIGLYHRSSTSGSHVSSYMRDIHIWSQLYYCIIDDVFILILDYIISCRIRSMSRHLMRPDRWDHHTSLYISNISILITMKKKTWWNRT